MKDTVASVTAVGQRLGVVFESVRRRFAAAVSNGQDFVALYQGEIDLGSVALNRAGLNVAGHAKALGVSAITHALQFFDGYVVTLAFLHACVGQIGQRDKDQGGGTAELQKFAGLVGHKSDSAARKTLRVTLRRVK